MTREEQIELLIDCVDELQREKTLGRIRHDIDVAQLAGFLFLYRAGQRDDRNTDQA